LQYKTGKVISSTELITIGYFTDKVIFQKEIVKLLNTVSLENKEQTKERTVFKKKGKKSK
jgi:hypothetical protein